jgi:hypothetical protein
MVTTVLLSTAVIILGAQAPKPGGWIALALGVLTILASALPHGFR